MNMLVRDVARVPDNYKNNPNVNIIVGDVTKLEDVQKTVDGQDGVVVTLGTRNDLGNIFYIIIIIPPLLILILYLICIHLCVVINPKAGLNFLNALIRYKLRLHCRGK